ncbi:DUF2318 domain-containing protein [Paucidesulfovibrio longus]|uniref:DUF2318 domain-containing protein n=1 Tax=Paucidesulfovibrio longus TaxID=889 RepID=UPI0003B7BB7E|nr:DUF2318 domain-containing protein [Paucidesulfovibrio longus]
MSNKIAVFVVLSFFVTIVVSFSGGDAQAFGFFSKYKSVEAVNGVVTVPVEEVDDGSAHFFEFDANGRSVRFFVLKSSDGVIRAAFDACDVCFEARKGYVQNGDFMICQNCGQKFHSARINEVRGGCNPAPLERTYDSNSVKFNVADIAAGAGYF